MGKLLKLYALQFSIYIYKIGTISTWGFHDVVEEIKRENAYNACKILSIVPRHKNNWVLTIITQSSMIAGTTCAQMSFTRDST